MAAGQYVALLRAINVGGRTVTMERLRGLFAELGFAGVRTYIQTGNVFFSTRASNRPGLSRTIEAHLSKALGYHVPVFLRSLDELEAIVRSSVFTNHRPSPEERCCVVFISEPARVGFSGSHTMREDFDVLAARPGELFIVWRFVNGRPGNPGAFIEKALSVKTTTRFFHTLVKMLDAAKRS